MVKTEKSVLVFIVFVLFLSLFASCAGNGAPSELQPFVNEQAGEASPEPTLSPAPAPSPSPEPSPTPTPTPAPEPEPSPAETPAPAAETPEVRGIYVTANRAGSEEHIRELAEACAGSEINAMVIDVRTEEGFVTFEGIGYADALGISRGVIPDAGRLLEILKENGIYPIARLVAFKDANTHNIKPELYIKNQNGSLWKDPDGFPWLNPYDREACEFVLEIAKGAAELGFREIQFDYVRFAAVASLDRADMGETGERTKTQAIEDFLSLAMETLRPYGVKVSADVYGTVINSDVDAAIVGQDYAAIAGIVDVICPMVYPSHYAPGSMGIDFPDLAPYDTIYRSMALSTERLSKIPAGSRKATVRPWLQEFTATWISPHLAYTWEERNRQIQAAYDAGLSEWLLWNPRVNYADLEKIIAKTDEGGQ